MLNLLHLKYFYDTIRLKSLSKAAQLNRVSQSAVSQAITRLEKSLHQPLLHHGKRVLVITSQGKLLYEKAASLITLHEQITASFAEQSPQKTVVSMACPYCFAMAFLDRVLKSMQQHHSDLHLKVIPCQPNQIKERLLSGEADIGITLNEEDIRGVNRELLLEGQYDLYGPASHKHLETAPMFLDSITIPKLDSWIETYNTRPLVEIGSNVVIAKLVEAGIGIGLFPDYLHTTNAFHIVPTTDTVPSLKYKLHCIWPKQPTLTTPIREIRSALKAAMTPNAKNV